MLDWINQNSGLIMMVGGGLVVLAFTVRVIFYTIYGAKKWQR